MKFQSLPGIIERTFRRLWRRYIHDPMPTPDRKKALALLKLGLRDP